MMSRWDSLIDKMVREAIGDGNVSHLPGAGEPLDLDNDPYTPNNMRLAFKIMKDNNVMPDWIMAGQALDKKETGLRELLKQRATIYQKNRSNTQRKGAIQESNTIDSLWNVFIVDFTDKVGHYNKEVLTYNLNIPRNITHKRILVPDKLIANALEQAKGET